MGILNAYYGADIDNLDFNYFAARYFDHDEFENNVFNPEEDNYHLVTTTGEALSYYGDGFSYDEQGRMVNGTVVSGNQWLWSEAGQVWQLVFEWSGLEVPMSALYTIGQSAGNADDLILWKDIFQMADVMKLSSYSDHMNGYKGNDKIYGYGGNDILDGASGNDKIFGGADNDIVNGGSGRDTVLGGNGADTVKGGGGDDIIRGGSGRDREVGGKGEDRFVFQTGDDKAFIQDFDAKGASHDVLDLSGLASIRGWRDLTRHHIERDGSDIRIDGGDGDVIVLRDVTLGTLDKGDFLF